MWGALRFFGEGGRKAIAIDPSFISKAGKKTPHIGRFWSGCAGAVKHGLEIMGLGLIDIDAHNCMMLRAHQNYSMANFKSLMVNTFLMKRIFAVSHYRPNQTLINHIFKELFGCAA